MSELRERLDDLLDATPSYVVADAGAAWRAGALRRRRRQVGAGVLVVVLVLLAGLGLGALPRPGTVDPAGTDRPNGAGVDGYPTRIAEPWRIGDLPHAPGPLAGLLSTREHRDTYDEPTGWLAVSADGGLSRLVPEGEDSGMPVAISDDGRRLAYFEDRDTFVVRDLVTGRRTVAPEVGDGSYDGNTETYDTDHVFGIGFQQGMWFSPDGRWVASSGTVNGEDPEAGAVVVGLDGTARLVPDQGWLTGWTEGGDLAWLATTEAGLVSVVTDLNGDVRSRMLLQGTATTRDRGQWTGSTWGDRVTVLGEGEDIDAAEMSSYDLATGARLEGPVPFDSVASTCPTSADRGTTFVPVADESAPLEASNGDRPVRIDQRLGVDCSIWARDALAGAAHRGVAGTLFGDSTSWLSWRWREVGLGTLVLLALARALVVRRRRVRLSGSAAPGSA